MCSSWSFWGTSMASEWGRADCGAILSRLSKLTRPIYAQTIAPAQGRRHFSEPARGPVRRSHHRHAVDVPPVQDRSRRSERVQYLVRLIGTLAGGRETYGGLNRTLTNSPLRRYHNKSLYIIDVSQSVEHDHPASFDFLRKDIQNMNDYFVKRSGGAVRTLGIKGAFDFIVNERLRGASAASVEDEDEDGLREVLRQWLEEGVGLQVESNAPEVIALPIASGAGASTSAAASTSAPPQDRPQSTRLNDNEFMSAYIPRSLAEVYDPERDTAKLSAGDKDLIYAGVTGLDAMPARASGPEGEATSGDQVSGSGEGRAVRFADDDEVSEADDGSSPDEDEGGERRPRGFRHEDREAKKVSHCASLSPSRWLTHAPSHRNGKRHSRRRTGRSAKARCPRQTRLSLSRRTAIQSDVGCRNDSTELPRTVTRSVSDEWREMALGDVETRPVLLVETRPVLLAGSRHLYHHRPRQDDPMLYRYIVHANAIDITRMALANAQPSCERDAPDRRRKRPGCNRRHLAMTTRRREDLSGTRESHSHGDGCGGCGVSSFSPW